MKKCNADSETCGSQHHSSPEARSDGHISGANTMPFVVEPVRAYATVGEISDVLHEVYGIYTETNAT